ncbi:MAG: helix-turn-helix transcriptional regulator [Candidatus Fimadaptatus sp.]|jgi:two-component system response regulator YesN
MFSLRALGDDPVYQQALCYDIISTYNLAMAKLGIGGRSDSQPFRTIDRGSIHIDRLLEMINDLYTEALDAFIAEEVPAQGNDISDIIAYIDSLRENIPNACELAERFGVSPSNLSHQFKRATGDTLASYIAERKMAIARQLLEETDMDVAQIGEKLGYTHPSSFIRMFHRVQGMTPAQYREEHSASGGET